MSSPTHRPRTGLQIVFHLLYNEFATFYDTIAWIVSAGRWNQWVLSVLRFVRPGRVLEIGFGPGHLYTQMKQAGMDVFGLDASPSMAHIAYRRIIAGKFNSSIVIGYAQFTPFPTAAFNQVLVTFPAPYIFHETTLHEIHRLLTPAGSLVILLAAEITGHSLPDWLAASILALTGKINTGLDAYTMPFKSAGFETHFEWVYLGTSRVLYIFAEPVQTSPDELP